MSTRYTDFAQFYPFYLSQHANRTCRRTHFIGSSLALLSLAELIATGTWWWLPVALVCGYGGAWIGHFVYEKNKPASFAQPLFSFRADWIMYWQMLSGKLSF